jgi:hypothetical protein
MPYLFHYTSINTLLNILDKNILKFNTIENVNDAYESKVFDIYDIEERIYDIWQFQKGQHKDAIQEIEEKMEKLGNEIELKKIEYEEIMYYEGKLKAEKFKLEHIKPLESKYSYYKTKKILKMKKLERNKYDKIIEKVNIYNQYNEYRKKGYRKLRNGLVKVSCFCTGKFSMENKRNNILRIRHGFFHPRMWAQYANYSKGCCIIFKENILKEMFNNLSNEYHVFDGLIEYVDLLNVGNINNISDKILDVYADLSKQGIINYLKKNVKLLFFRKDIDWSDEKEYRLLLINRYKNRNKKPYFMDINNAIDSIILGENFRLEDEFELNLDYIKKNAMKKE